MCGATERASALLKLYTPPFAAQKSCAYSPFIPPVSTWSQDMFRITPPSGCCCINSTAAHEARDRKSTRLNSSHGYISYAVFCLKKKKKKSTQKTQWRTH